MHIGGKAAGSAGRDIHGFVNDDLMTCVVRIVKLVRHVKDPLILRSGYGGYIQIEDGIAFHTGDFAEGVEYAIDMSLLHIHHRGEIDGTGLERIAAVPKVFGRGLARDIHGRTLNVFRTHYIQNLKRIGFQKRRHPAFNHNRMVHLFMNGYHDPFLAAHEDMVRLVDDREFPALGAARLGQFEQLARSARKGTRRTTGCRPVHLGNRHAYAVYNHVIHAGSDIDETSLRRKVILRGKLVALRIIETHMHHLRQFGIYLGRQFRVTVQVKVFIPLHVCFQTDIQFQIDIG